jgi:type II secretory pathway pseudopilin PulG
MRGRFPRALARSTRHPAASLASTEASMARRGSQCGALLMLAALVLLLGVAAVLLCGLAGGDAAAKRARATEHALAQAREALIAYAADRPISPAVGPGYLPCPDLDNDGWAESTCGSQDGASGQAQRLGRLPWKTLGLDDLRDGDGERLWYAVSSKYKGLLNCGVSRACVDMTPAVALGTITVRDASGLVLHDGTLADPEQADAGGAVAVVIAPGAPLARTLGADGADARDQVRDCAPGDCDADGHCVTDPAMLAATCNPLNYLDRASGAHFDEDNADFVDRNDAPGRAANRNGFIAGPVALPDGRIAVNDRILALGFRDVMPSIMKRVAVELAHCLRYYASRPENGGRYPWPAAACPAPGAGASAPEVEGALFGAIPDTPFERTRSASAQRMLPGWWRAAPRAPENLSELPTRDDACRIAIEPDDAGPQRAAPPGTPDEEAQTAGRDDNAWWSAWKPYAFYALASGYRPGESPASGCGDGSACIELTDALGRSLGGQKQFAVVVARSCSAAPKCAGAAGCARVVLDADSHGIGNALAAFP